MEQVNTHWENCGMEGGPRHYECLKRDAKKLAEAMWVGIDSKENLELAKRILDAQ